MIKFSFTNIWNSKKGASLFLGFLLLAFFLFWPFPALAQFWETLKNAILFIPYALISLVLLFFIVATQAFAWLTGFILDITMSPTLISLSYTNPATNQIIRSGLSITQSFVSLILVLALVYTALSIALRLGDETQAKKMLARLIIVALLVNFAPVFCGLVVDASNIVMYYFLKPLEGGVSGVLTQIGPFVDMVKNTIWGASADITNRLGVIMMAVTMIMVNVSMAIAFFLYAAIFLFRYVAIWTLVILAPIAFVAWVFPAGTKMRGLWDMWLNQFIEWSIIGIPIAFFLYLAMGSFSLMTAAFKTKIEMPGIEATAVGFFNEVFPYFVVIVFLFLGFTIGLQTGAMGTKGIIAGFRAAHKTAQKTTLRALGRTTGRALMAPVREAGRIRRTYQAGRSLGLSPPRAMGEAIIRYTRRMPRRIIRAAPQAVRGAGRGIYSAVRDVAQAGLVAAKVMKRGFRRCPTCGNPRVARSAAFCPTCGHVF